MSDMDSIIKQNLRRVSKKFVDDADGIFSNDILSEIYIAGGAMSSILRNDTVNDYDFYFRRISDIRKRIMTLIKQPDSPWYEFAWEITEDGTIYNNGKKAYCNGRDLVHPDCSPMTPIFITPYCVTTKGGYQFITKWHGDPNKLVSNFDFEHCSAWGTIDHDSLYGMSSGCLFANARKELMYKKSHATLSSMIRLRKFIKRGWKVSTATIVEMALDLASIDFSNRDVFLEQMTGVDIVSTTGLLEIVQDTCPEGANIDIESIRYLLKNNNIYDD